MEIFHNFLSSKNEDYSRRKRDEDDDVHTAYSEDIHKDMTSRDNYWPNLVMELHPIEIVDNGYCGSY